MLSHFYFSNNLETKFNDFIFTIKGFSLILNILIAELHDKSYTSSLMPSLRSLFLQSS